MRSLEEISKLIEQYPVDWRRWCGSQPCACMGCVHCPAPMPIAGEYAPAHSLTRNEVELYLQHNPDGGPPPQEAFALFLLDIGPDRLKVIREVRHVLRISYQEAKTLVDNGGLVQAEPKREVLLLKKAVENVGAVCEIR